MEATAVFVISLGIVLFLRLVIFNFFLAKISFWRDHGVECDWQFMPTIFSRPKHRLLSFRTGPVMGQAHATCSKQVQKTSVCIVSVKIQPHKNSDHTAKISHLSLLLDLQHPQPVHVCSQRQRAEMRL